MEEEDIPWAGLHHDGLPQDPDDSRQPLRVHRGQVPRPLVTQPAKLVRAGDDLQAAILPEQHKIWEQKNVVSTFRLPYYIFVDTKKFCFIKYVLRDEAGY